MEKLSFNDFLVTEISKSSAKATLLKFLRYKQGEIIEKEITIDWMLGFSSYLDERNLTNNSKKLYLTIMHTILRRAKRRGYEVPLDVDDSIAETKVKKEASESVYLSVGELRLIEEYEPKGTQSAFARALFLVCAYTGCRISDGQILSDNNIHNGEVNYVSEKSKTTSRLPAHPKLSEWIKRSSFHSYDEDSIRGIIGREIKLICESVGICDAVTIFRRGQRSTEPKWKFVSSHTARKSFATNMLLDGYSIEQVSKMMGHTSIEMTNRYICVSHTDRVIGTFSYLNPEKKDEVYARLESVIKFGLTPEIAGQALLAAGVEKSEIERVINKYKLANAKI